jgi:hypothetical protein
MRRGLIAVAVAMASALIAANSGVAAPPQPQTLTCEGLGDVQILVGPANGADQSFGAARVVGDGHLIPVNFRFSAFDVDNNMTLFDSGLVSKGNGNGNRNQPTIFCSSTETATLADFLDPGEPVPPGANLTDTVTFTIDVNAILKS